MNYEHVWKSAVLRKRVQLLCRIVSRPEIGDLTTQLDSLITKNPEIAKQLLDVVKQREVAITNLLNLYHLNKAVLRTEAGERALRDFINLVASEEDQGGCEENPLIKEYIETLWEDAAGAHCWDILCQLVRGRWKHSISDQIDALLAQKGSEAQSFLDATFGGRSTLKHLLQCYSSRQPPSRGEMWSGALETILDALDARIDSLHVDDLEAVLAFVASLRLEWVCSSEATRQKEFGSSIQSNIATLSIRLVELGFFQRKDSFALVTSNELTGILERYLSSLPIARSDPSESTSDRILAERREARFGVLRKVFETLQSSETMAQLAGSLQDLLENNGLQPIGKQGALVEFDPLEHECNGPMFPQEEAKVMSIGWAIQGPPKRVLLKARVTPLEETE